MEDSAGERQFVSFSRWYVQTFLGDRTDNQRVRNSCRRGEDEKRGGRIKVEVKIIRKNAQRE